MRDYYDVLGVARDASETEIAVAFHQLTAGLDVKRDGLHGRAQREHIEKAFEVLGDARLRQAYNDGLAQAIDVAQPSRALLTLVVVVASSVAGSLAIWLALVHFGLVPGAGSTPEALQHGRPPSTGPRIETKTEPLRRRSARTTQRSAPVVAETERKPPPKIAAAIDAKERNTNPATPIATGSATTGHDLNQGWLTGSWTNVGRRAPPKSNPPGPGKAKPRVTTRQAGVADQTGKLPSRSVASVSTGSLTPRSHSRNPARRDRPTAGRQSRRKATARWRGRARKKPAAVAKPKPASWTLLARRWSPRFEVGAFSINLVEKCSDCRWFRLVARRRDVRIHEARAHYGDGTSRALMSSRVVRDDRDAKPFRVGERAAATVRLSVVHQSKFNMHGRGWLEVWGLRGRKADPAVAAWSR